jgi:prepilin-type N-terminal cleavage/methylation domain-containing protein
LKTIFMTGTLNMKKEKKGFTLIELLIAIGLFSILVAIAAEGYVSALRTQRQIASLISAQSNAGLALEQMTREVRTGYLFCHLPGQNIPIAACGCTQTLGSMTGPSGPLWTCSSLDFYNAQSEHVNYSLVGGDTLSRSDSAQNGGALEAITSNSVSVSSLRFLLEGQIEGDNWTPRITILMAVAPSSTDPTFTNDTLDLQSTVSAREIDCSPSGGC